MDYNSFTTRFHVSRETYSQLCGYYDLLIKWQRSINLIGPGTLNDIWERHILDACQFHPLVVSRETATVDLGSGAGIPGAILSILGVENMHLIESDQKKVIFLNEVKRQLNLSYTPHATRIEKTALSQVGTITARGCASLTQLLGYCHHLISPQTICLFAKGKNYAKEIEQAMKQWCFEITIHPSITDSQSALLELAHIRKRSP